MRRNSSCEQVGLRNTPKLPRIGLRGHPRQSLCVGALVIEGQRVLSWGAVDGSPQSWILGEPRHGLGRMLAIIQIPQTEQAELQVKFAQKNPMQLSRGDPLDVPAALGNLTLVMQIFHSMG